MRRAFAFTFVLLLVGIIPARSDAGPIGPGAFGTPTITTFVSLDLLYSSKSDFYRVLNFFHNVRRNLGFVRVHYYFE